MGIYSTGTTDQLGLSLFLFEQSGNTEKMKKSERENIGDYWQVLRGMLALLSRSTVELVRVCQKPTGSLFMNIFPMSIYRNSEVRIRESCRDVIDDFSSVKIRLVIAIARSSITSVLSHWILFTWFCGRTVSRVRSIDRFVFGWIILAIIRCGLDCFPFELTSHKGTHLMQRSFVILFQSNLYIKSISSVVKFTIDEKVPDIDLGSLKVDSNDEKTNRK